MSARRIIGFACTQAFVFLLLFPGTGQETGRFELLFTMVFMVAGFGLVRLLGPAWFDRVFSRPLLYIYAVIAAGGSLLAFALPDGGVPVSACQGLLVGAPSALLLTAWGRAFGREPSKASVPEVFLGSLVGALVCLVFSFAADSAVVSLAVRLLPLASVVNIEVQGEGASGYGLGEAEGGSGAASAAAGANRGADAARAGMGAGLGANAGVARPATGGGEAQGEARLLSFKILAGTLLFGMAEGLLLGCQGESSSYYRVSVVLYGAFLIGGLSLLLSDGFGRGAALNKSYRLAVFVMMIGVLIVPWPLMATSVLPGEAVVLAGFLGLEVVLISLFIVLAEITGTDCALSFSSGFAALFAGGLLGALAVVALGREVHLVVVLAGAITLFSYIFLFTERDFDALSQLVVESDSIEAACAEISEKYGLSNRESEILAFALRGRTSERIAQELVISKSTVDTHLRRIYAKCGVHSRQELLDLAE